MPADPSAAEPGSPPEATGVRGVPARHPGALLVVAALGWAGAGLILRGAPLSGPSMAFWRCLLAAAIYHAVLAARGTRPSWTAVRTSWLGGVGFGLSVVCLFIAYKSTTLTSAAVIASLQPLVLGVVTHRTSHRLGGVLWAASAAAAAGTILVQGSASSSVDWSLRGDLFAAAGIAANVLYLIGTKRATATLGALEYQASMLCVATVVVAPIAVVEAGGSFVPGADAWVWVLALIAVGGSGHLLFSAAQAHVSVAASAAITLTEVLAVAVGAALLYEQPITAAQAVGMGVVGAAVGVWLTRSPADGADGVDDASDPDAHTIEPAASLELAG